MNDDGDLIAEGSRSRIGRAAPAKQQASGGRMPVNEGADSAQARSKSQRQHSARTGSGKRSLQDVGQSCCDLIAAATKLVMLNEITGCGRW